MMPPLEIAIPLFVLALIGAIVLYFFDDGDTFRRRRQ